MRDFSPAYDRFGSKAERLAVSIFSPFYPHEQTSSLTSGSSEKCLQADLPYICAKPTGVSVSVSGGCKSRDKSTVVPVTPKSLGVTSSQPLSSAYRRPAV